MSYARSHGGPGINGLGVPKRRWCIRARRQLRAGLEGSKVCGATGGSDRGSENGSSLDRCTHRRGVHVHVDSGACWHDLNSRAATKNCTHEYHFVNTEKSLVMKTLPYGHASKHRCQHEREHHADGCTCQGNSHFRTPCRTSSRSADLRALQAQPSTAWRALMHHRLFAP